MLSFELVPFLTKGKRVFYGLVIRTDLTSVPLVG